jgi:hypothetical protein
LAASDYASSTDDELLEEEEEVTNTGGGTNINWNPVLCEITGRPLVLTMKKLLTKLQLVETSIKQKG